jgi:hypothetical protein
MTRGRRSNTAHLIATTPDEARTLWVEVFGRDRADLGPAHAAAIAAHDAARYAPTPAPAAALAAVAPRVEPVDLGVLARQLRQAWDYRQSTARGVALLQSHLDTALAAQADLPATAQRLADAMQAEHGARIAAETARAALAEQQARLDATTTRLAGQWQHDWDRDRPSVRAAGQRIAAGPGRFGLGRAAVTAAQDAVDNWAAHWTAILPTVPWYGKPARYAATLPTSDRVRPDLEGAARDTATRLHPEHARTAETVRDADQQLREAQAVTRDARRRHDRTSTDSSPDNLTRLRADLGTITALHAEAVDRVAGLSRDLTPTDLQRIQQLQAQQRHREQHTAERARMSRSFDHDISPSHGHGIGI